MKKEVMLLVLCVAVAVTGCKKQLSDAEEVGAENVGTIRLLRDVFNLEFRHACLDTKAAPGTSACIAEAKLKPNTDGVCYENEKDAALYKALQHRNVLRRTVELTLAQYADLSPERHGLLVDEWVCVWDASHPNFGIRFGTALRKLGGVEKE